MTPPPEACVSERLIHHLPCVNATVNGEKPVDEGIGVMDTACLLCVSGKKWYENYKDILTEMGLADQILEEPEDEVNRFGNGGTLPSKLRVTAPLVLCGQAGRIVFSVVDSPTLGLLIGRDFI